MGRWRNRNSGDPSLEFDWEQVGEEWWLTKARIATRVGAEEQPVRWFDGAA
jgi:hypothetical protein